MLATFLELNSKGLHQRSEKEKEGRCLLFKSSTRGEIAAKKCTKKRDARVKLFFCQAETYCFFLPFSLPSPSSLLKLPIIV